MPRSAVVRFFSQRKRRATARLQTEDPISVYAYDQNLTRRAVSHPLDFPGFKKPGPAIV